MIRNIESQVQAEKLADREVKNLKNSLQEMQNSNLKKEEQMRERKIKVKQMKDKM